MFLGHTCEGMLAPIKVVAVWGSFSALYMGLFFNYVSVDIFGLGGGTGL